MVVCLGAEQGLLCLLLALGSVLESVFGSVGFELVSVLEPERVSALRSEWRCHSPVRSDLEPERKLYGSAQRSHGSAQGSHGSAKRSHGPQQ